jgi:hypothetical protein
MQLYIVSVPERSEHAGTLTRETCIETLHHCRRASLGDQRTSAIVLERHPVVVRRNLVAAFDVEPDPSGPWQWRVPIMLADLRGSGRASCRGKFEL